MACAGTFYTTGYFGVALTVVIIFITVLTGLAVAVPMNLGLKNLKSMEY
jgi:hypothetical protein